jgi:hypothetical protein
MFTEELDRVRMPNPLLGAAAAMSRNNQPLEGKNNEQQKEFGSQVGG